MKQKVDELFVWEQRERQKKLIGMEPVVVLCLSTEFPWDRNEAVAPGQGS